MATPERTGEKEHSSSYFNENGSYTRFGAQMEISKYVIRVPNNYNLVEMAELKKMKVVPRFDEIPQGIAFLTKPDVPIFEEPAKHANNSGAEYGIDWFRYKAEDGRENIIWFSRIPPLKGTSKPPHTHGTHPSNGNGVYEHYIKVAGTAFIGEEDRREMAEYEVIPPHTPHYIEAGEESGAVIFILIENVEGIKDEDIHLYTDSEE